MNDMSTIYDTDNDLLIISKNMQSMSMPDLESALGQKLANTLAESGAGISRKFMIDTIIQLNGRGIFQNKIIRKHFCELANIIELKAWSSSKQAQVLLSAFNLSDSFLPSPKEIRGLKFNSTPGFILHKYQESIKKQVTQFLLSKNKNKLMVQLPTGAGKTSLAMEAIYDFFRFESADDLTVVWMAHTDELCEQAIESFQRGWVQKGTFEVRILRVWGGHAKRLGQELDIKVPTFAVTSFQSANSMIKTSSNDVMKDFIQFRQMSRLIVVDEAHMTLAETYKQSIDMFAGNNSKIIGLTATPGRHGVDGDQTETDALVEYYEDNIINMNQFCNPDTPIKFLQNEKILSRVKRLKLVTNTNIELSESDKLRIANNLSISDKLLAEIGDDTKRNLLIIDQIQKAIQIQDIKKILVFASSKDNSDLLAALLSIRGIEAKSITGVTDPNERIKAVQDFKTAKFPVLINYNVFTAGFDDPKIDCVFIARPTYSVVLYSQMIGRGLRGTLNGGTDECLVVDMVDNVQNQPDIEIAGNFFEDNWNI
jgi:DNA repair protein RadD